MKKTKIAAKKPNGHERNRFPRWFREQEHKRFGKFKILLLSLIKLAIVILLIILTIKIHEEIKKSFWDGKHNFTFSVLDNNYIYIFSFQRKPEMVNILQIPPDTYLGLAKGFGEYPAGSIWNLGEMEKYGGGVLLQLSSQNFLGVPVLGWGKVAPVFKSSGVKDAKPVDSLSKRGLTIMIGKLLFTDNKNLSDWDIVRLLYQANGIAANKINFWTLSETRAGEKIILPDGSEAFKIQQDFMDNLSKKLFQDVDVFEEGVIWALLNQTNHSGLAGGVSRLIDNTGGGAAAFYDEDRELPEGIYCWTQEVCQSYTANLLSASLKLKIIEKNINESRAEGLIVLDENYWDYFFKR